jgi:hypothetical protein
MGNGCESGREVRVKQRRQPEPCGDGFQPRTARQVHQRPGEQPRQVASGRGARAGAPLARIGSFTDPRDD